MTTLEIQLQTQKDLAKAHGWVTIHINHPDELKGRIPDDNLEIYKALIKIQRWITYEITSAKGMKITTLYII